MTNDIFIGVDGGATKSTIRVEDSEGNVLGEAEGGPANITRASVEHAWREIYNALNPILASQQLSLDDKNHQFHIGLGLAGCELPDVRANYLKVPHSFKTIQLTTDAHIACLGAHLGKDGAIIIIGTGVVGYQMQDDHEAKVSGWGFPHDDEGGGAWLGLEAARLTFQWLDKRLQYSPLLEDVFLFFNNDIHYFVTWANRAKSSDFGRLAPLVIKHSQREESVAIQLMRRAACAIDLVGEALQKNQLNDDKPLPCALFGGIAPFIKPWLGADLQKRLVDQQSDAKSGALLLIRKSVKESK